MFAFIQQIIAILTSSPGNLSYHLVLAFSVAGALATAINAWRSTGFPQARRMVIGLSLLLAIRLALFGAAGVAWQGLLSEHLLLPPIDRAASLLSLTIILWLWLFPEPVRPADAAHILLGLLTLTLMAFTLTWWINIGQDMPYNGSWPDFLGEIIQIAVLSGGLLALLFRRPNAWGYGLGMLIILIAGHSIYLLLPASQGDYQGIVRLAEMIAYPLLLALPQRFPVPSTAPAPLPVSTEPAGASAAADSAFLQAALAIAAAGSLAEACCAAARLAANAAGADLCLVLFTPGEDGLAPIGCAYDRNRDEVLPATGLDERRIPVLASALRLGRPLRLPGSSTSPDMAALAQTLHLNQSGNLLATPLLTPENISFGALILLSPVSQRAWNANDSARMVEISRPLAYLLHRIEAMNTLQSELTGRLGELSSSQAEGQGARQEIARMQSQLESLRIQSARDRAEAESLAALLKAQGAIPSPAAVLNPPLAGTNTSAEIRRLEGELRLALEEIARLNASASDTVPQPVADTNLTGSNNGASQKSATIAGELRRPAASIVEYTSLILSEAPGRLDAHQRKLIERIKVSGERVRSLVDDLFASLARPASLSAGWLDLSQVATAAAARAEVLFDSKNATLSRDLPSGLPLLNADGAILESVIYDLLAAAAAAVPQAGTARLSARLEHERGQPDWLLLQVVDGGKPIPPADLPSLFSGIASGAATSEAGHARSLAGVRASVEALHGRLWVDSTTSSGNTYHLLLPLEQIGLASAGDIRLPTQASLRRGLDTTPGEEQE